MTAHTTAVLSTSELSKNYGTVRVLTRLNLDFFPGTIHALLGENGAGKSTLIKLLSGAATPTSGTVLRSGRPQPLRSVREAQTLGIVALPQELTLVPTLDAAENIFLGMRRAKRSGLIHRARLRADASRELARLGQQLPVNVPVAEFSAVQQTMVALARALARNAQVLILDEPTATLSDAETAQLFAVLRDLRKAGTAIIYVSHRLEEVFALADTATVLRGGNQVWTKPMHETSQDEVIAAMSGRDHGRSYPPRARRSGTVVLEIEQLSGKTVRDVSMRARAGRVLGIAGLAGSGRSELLKMIAGAQRAGRGTIRFDAIDITRYSLAKTMNLGVVLVPEERRSQGLVMTASVQENIALANLRELSRFGMISGNRERAMAARGRDALQLTARSLQQAVIELSGGNQQKIVLAKYLERAPRLLLLDEPTRGIDIGTKTEIYQLIRRLAENDLAVIMVSSDIPELIGVADEIAVLHEGTVAGMLPASEATETSLLQLCYRKVAS